jgi:hypothetical protein
MKSPSFAMIRRSGNSGTWKKASGRRLGRQGKASGCGAAMLTIARTGAAAYARVDQAAMPPQSCPTTTLEPNPRLLITPATSNAVVCGS